MAKDTNEIGLVCPSVESAFSLLGRKWIGLIIHVLSPGPLHFCELQRAIPSVSARMLTERVKDLEAAGVVSRTVFTGTPVRVTYQLSEKGRALIPVMQGIEKWARVWERTEPPHALPSTEPRSTLAETAKRVYT